MNEKYKDFLFYKYDLYREENKSFYLELPVFIKNNLNMGNLLRKYQDEAFRNFRSLYEDDRSREDWSQIDNLHVLFHMATGSGKTLIMAGLILYLYTKGYRNFLFFVNRKEIIEKTIANFIEKNSDKYLFNNHIFIDNKEIFIKKVKNFSHADKDNINICFTTIHTLANRMYEPIEDSLSIQDFRTDKVVLIADEAHHLNQEVRNNRYTSEDVIKYVNQNRYNSEKECRTWQYVVEQCKAQRNDNLLLEFTATCPIDNNELIREFYKNKIIYNYPLFDYQNDGYSKEIRTFKTPENLNRMDRALIACIFNEFRNIVFSKFVTNKICKPVILFKSRYSDESFDDDRIKETTKYNMDLFIDYIKNLTVEKIKDVFSVKNDDKDNHYIEYMLNYFVEHKISFSSILEMIKNDFSEEKILYANETNEKMKTDIIKNLNSLESANNKYRAIFDCNTLTEGWDVLNLFDIVRLYETRQGGNAEATISEAQLIGRGARYYPFLVDKNENPEREYIRKYSKSDKNPLYFCETMFYHCYSNSSYISELREQLKEQGVYNDDDKKQITVKVKRSFINTPLYRDGYFFNNSQDIINNSEYKVSDLYGKFPTQFNGYIEGASSENLVLGNIRSDNAEYKTIKIKEIAKFNYFLVRKHMVTQNSYLRFDKLRQKYPALNTLSDFILKDEYIGNFSIDIKTSNEKLNYNDFNIALPHFFKAINDIIKDERKYKGSKFFTKVPIKDVIGEEYKISIKKDDDNCGIGISQMSDKCSTFKKSSNSKPYDMQIKNLNELEWYAFEDNIGTTEEKAFVYEFSKRYDDLCECFETVRLVRNEEKLKLYRFDDGEGFKPDFILILKKKNKQASYIQVFFEPKGIHLMKYDEEKEKFLFAISNDKDVKVEEIIGQNNEIQGAPFFNMDYEHNKDFNDFIDKLIRDNLG